MKLKRFLLRYYPPGAQELYFVLAAILNNVLHKLYALFQYIHYLMLRNLTLAL